MQLRASHILVDTKEQADDLLKEMKESGASFADLAKKHSKCPSGQEGGDLRWFNTGMMVKPFEDACLAMNEDEVSAPVKTQFGYHLIQLTGKKE